MQWTSHFVAQPERAAAVAADILRTCSAALNGKTIHLLLLFISPAAHPLVDDLVADLRAALPASAGLIGCSAAGLTLDGREHEDTGGIAVLAAHLPDVGVVPFSVSPAETRTRTAAEWRAALDLIPEQQPVFLLLPDPFSVDGQGLLDGLDDAFPGCPKVGGLTSGGRTPGSHRLVCNDRVERAGAVGVALWGDIRMATIVAQGARPVGPVLEVTDARGPAILGLTQEERVQFQQGPAIGIAPVDDATGTLRAHDFLVRNMLGFKRSDNALMVGANVSVGDRIQLRIRDASSADQELRDLADRLARVPATAQPRGAVLFTCLGRGVRFFGLPDHDVTVLRGRLDAPPLAGFFCNGELGPVRGRSWMHSYTASVGLFYPRGWS
jgi:small ligand-binding sensory domain FIST